MNLNSFLLIAAFLFVQLAASAQSYTLKAVVADSITSTELPGTNVVLMKKDSSIISATTSSSNGSFKIIVEPGDYILKLSYISYTPKEIAVQIVNDDLDLGLIKLQENPLLLEMVEIEAKIPPVIQKGDTTQFNAGAFKTSTDASAEQLINKLPGVINQNGKVQVQGEEVTRILVDGKEFFGNDPNAALKNLPAEMIDKVEMYDQESEQAQFTGFSDGNTEKTINLITKKEFKNGSFGRVYGRYGTDDRYQAGGVINNFNGNRRITVLGQTNNINRQNFSSGDLSGISSGGGRGRRNSDFQVSQGSGINKTNAAGLNYSDQWGEKTEFTGSYLFNNRNNSNFTSLRRQYVGSSRNSEQIYNEQEENRSEYTNHGFNFRLEHEFNENNSILFRPSLNLQSSEGNSFMKGETFQDQEILNLSRNTFSSEFKSLSLSNSLLWRHKFAEKGRTFSLDLSQSINNSDGDSRLSALNQYIDQESIDSTEQQSFLEQFESSYSAKAEYTEPMGENTQLQFKYESTISLNSADKQTLNFNPSSNAYDIADSLLSNISESRYTSNEAGTGIRYSKDKWMMMASTSVQHAAINTEEEFPSSFTFKRDFISILPFAMVRYEFRKGKNLRLSYRTNTSAPSIRQLQEVIDNSNPIQLRTGNPNLKQSYAHSLYFNYRTSNTDKNTFFYAMFGGGYTNNHIANNLILAQQDTLIDNRIFLPRGSQLNRPENVNGFYNLRFYSTYSFPIDFLKSNLGINASANYTQIPGIVNNEINYSRTPSGGIGFNLSSNISEKVDFSIATNSRWSQTSNTSNPRLNTKYFNQNSRISLYWNFWKTLIYRTDLNHQYNLGLSEGFNNNYALLNMSLGTKVFKDKQGELSFSVYDLLNQNQSVSRTVTETYIQDSNTQVLQQYFMLNFTYQFRFFAKD